ncbi:uncharacterized protein LOC123562972 [Mercenaria mercenaria]|uniref:uncharacterized protein LOC123562972 n=1 Tax=Mercenaria mercenaria TaxID=6596 RepID=UPI00234F8AA2|nr:uncharacterized protein LOC123562972 [Mercenaria mercenaria]XP_053393525.1 uncharacterized protein LOC123562972 [Mercenaria mercenaria]
MNYILLATCLAVFSGHVAGAYEVCNNKTVDPAWYKCDKTYFVTEIKDEASMKKMCQNVECLVKCKKDAVGDCDKREEFREHLLIYDPEKWKVYLRFTCSNLESVMQQFDGGCEESNVCGAESIGKNFNPVERKQTSFLQGSTSGTCTTVLSLQAISSVIFYWMFLQFRSI